MERKLTLRDFGHEIIKKDLHLDPFHVESQSAETVLTPDECQLLGYLDKGKRKRKEKAGSLQWAYMAIARLGGFMDSKRTGIASWGALW